jgi:hypothetical protein
MLKGKWMLAMMGLAASGAAQTTLWDQSNYDESANGQTKLDTEVASGAYVPYSTYSAVDFQASGAWTITAVTFYFSGSDTTFASRLTGVRLGIGSDSGSAPTFNPQASTLYTTGISTTNVGANTIALKLSGLNLQVAAGTYWLNFTPQISAFTANSDRGDLRTTLPNTIWGQQSYLINPGGGFGLGSNSLPMSYDGVVSTSVDAAFKIEGQAVPEPMTIGLIGLGVAAQLRRRSR